MCVVPHRQLSQPLLFWKPTIVFSWVAVVLWPSDLSQQYLLSRFGLMPNPCVHQYATLIQNWRGPHPGNYALGGLPEWWRLGLSATASFFEILVFSSRKFCNSPCCFPAVAERAVLLAVIVVKFSKYCSKNDTLLVTAPAKLSMYTEMDSIISLPGSSTDVTWTVGFCVFVLLMPPPRMALPTCCACPRSFA